MTAKKIGRPPPEWLKKLDSGYYTAKELEKITGKSGRSIRIVMIFHGATVEYKFNGKAIEGIFDMPPT
jgi:hypothetical protein